MKRERGQHRGQGNAERHWNHACLHDLKSPRRLIEIRYKHEQKMHHFGHNASSERERQVGNVVIEHVLAECRCICTSEDGAQAARHAGKLSHAPHHRKPALDSTNKTCDDASWPTEEQASCQRRGITHVHHGAVQGNACFGAVNGDEPEDDTNDNLPAPFGDARHACALPKQREHNACHHGHERCHCKLCNRSDVHVLARFPSWPVLACLAYHGGANWMINFAN